MGENRARMNVWTSHFIEHKCKVPCAIWNCLREATWFAVNQNRSHTFHLCNLHKLSWGMIIILAMLSGCATVYQPLPPPKVYNFSIRQLDPPIQDENEKGCVPVGFDGLACRDNGMRI